MHAALACLDLLRVFSQEIPAASRQLGEWLAVITDYFEVDRLRVRVFVAPAPRPRVVRRTDLALAVDVALRFTGARDLDLAAIRGDVLADRRTAFVLDDLGFERVLALDLDFDADFAGAVVSDRVLGFVLAFPFAFDARLPVDPNPPVPRLDFANFFETLTLACMTGATTN